MNRFRDVLDASETARIDLLLAHLDATCRRLGVDYAMIGGTLVGSMLHHGRIPWDDDVDVYVRAWDRARLTRALRRKGFVVTSAGRYAKLWSTTFPRVDNHRPWNWPFVDIGWLAQNATHIWEERSAEWRYRHAVYPKEWVFPSVRRPFGAHVLSAPRRADRILRHRLGSRWSSTCVVNHWDHKLERWRYAGGAENTRTPCATLDVGLVHRTTLGNGTSFEWLVNRVRGHEGPRLTFLHGSLQP